MLYTPQDIAPGERRAAAVVLAGFTYLKSLLLPDIAKALNAAGYRVFVVGVPGPFPNRDALQAARPDMTCESLVAAVAALLAQPGTSQG